MAPATRMRSASASTVPSLVLANGRGFAGSSATFTIDPRVALQ